MIQEAEPHYLEADTVMHGNQSNDGNPTYGGDVVRAFDKINFIAICARA